MKRKKQQWLKEIDEVSHQFTEAFSGLNAKELSFKPSPGRWSIAENIDHLMILNESYFPVIEAVKQGTYRVPLLGKIDFISRLIGNLIYKSVLPQNKNKLKTFAIWQPSASNVKDDILNRFLDHQEQLKEKIESLSDEELNITISSPANKFLHYKLHTAFDIVIQHERRHFEQVKNILEQLALKEEAI